MPRKMTQTETPIDTWTPEYERWRHGGWYVTNVTYPSGAIGCVHNSKGDGRWYVEADHTETSFPTRDAAARAERVAAAMFAEKPTPDHGAPMTISDIVPFEHLVKGVMQDNKVKLGNVDFWVDETGPWAGALSYSVPTSQWRGVADALTAAIEAKETIDDRSPDTSPLRAPRMLPERRILCRLAADDDA
jgi:hypothetical protein